MMDPEEVISQMEKFKTAAQNHQSYSHRLANGSIRDVDVFSCPITFDGKTLLYSIINDITDRKLAEQALQTSERKFRSITEQLAEMVFVTDSLGALTYISPASEHLFGYLPQEMNGILGFSALLTEPHLSGEEMAEYIGLIQKSGHRMLNLINDLIDISRIDAEETKVHLSETPLNELMHDLHACS